ncbi:MAG: hypothetical protein J6W76_02525, partial [Spirochaetales bacterium]|nr:hypothetical protein [Spirochaetales bacterium]
NVSPNITYFYYNGLPSFCTDYTFNWGWEFMKDRIVYRHEIGLFCQANFCMTAHPLDYINSKGERVVEKMEYGVSPTVSIGLSYHFSAGVRYNPGQIQMRQ